MLLYKNKSGQISIFLLLLVVGLIFSLIFLFIGGVTTIKINDALNQNITMGNVNLATINSQTFGVAAQTYLDYADWWGFSAIMGLILGLFLSAYFTRNSSPKWGIVLDIFIILAVFILSVYVSKTYNILLDAFASAGETFLETYTPKSSLFMVNLPIFVVIIGVVMMIVFHSSLPRKKEEIYQAGGYLQGAY